MKKSFITFWKDMLEAQKVTNACIKKTLERICATFNDMLFSRLCYTDHNNKSN